MTTRRAFTAAILLSVVLLAASPSEDDHAVVQWMREHAVPLKTVEAGHGFDDMEPLQRVVGNARIVALGEATHGTREFFQLKHRMLEFLATKMGFTIFSIEANMPEAYRLNDYVLNGNGDPAKLLKGMYFWTWDTQEVLDMVQWMREFNRSGKGRVQFTGFDMQTPDVAMGIVQDFVTKSDLGSLPKLRRAMDLVKGATLSSNATFGVVTGTFPVTLAAGKKVRFSGSIKTENITRGWAGLWWRVDGASGVLAFDNMQERGVTGTTDWKQYQVELPVAADAKNINFGAILPGDGTAWFDDLKIELDGVPYTDTTVFDLGFESPTPRGFYTSGNGYSVQLDPHTAHAGKQSLQMKFLPDLAPKNSVDAKTAAASWKEVVQHMQESRAAYRDQGLSTSDIDWAIQNARVVLQAMQMTSGEVSRDQSMADNVKWIAEQNPGAKIVLWAHNGHAAYGGWPGYEPMGSVLHKVFGDRMVNFGFAFNQGSFQAVQMGKGLRDFTVGPAPAGSLDATLAATGISVFALDLRTAKDGPVGGWLHSPHQTRSIGAIYSDDAAQQSWANQDVTQGFDALLFVEKTTAARKNPDR